MAAIKHLKLEDVKMANTDKLMDLMAKIKEAKQKEKQIREERKALSNIAITEYTDGLSPEAKAEQIKQAEQIVKQAKQKLENAKALYKQTVREVKADMTFSKEILNFVTHKQNHSLPKRKQDFVFSGKMMTYKRDGIKNIEVDISKPNWKTAFTAELAKQGINGDDRVSANAVYTAGVKLAEEISAGKIKI